RIPMSTLGTKLSPLSTQDEYEALLKEILESDSSDEERSRRLILSSRNHKSPSHYSDSILALDLDLDLDLAPDLDPVYSKTGSANHTKSRSKGSDQGQIFVYPLPFRPILSSV
ncbi:hypothetical protein BGX20_011167, partial [Mortierella sp. AD010]